MKAEADKREIKMREDLEKKDEEIAEVRAKGAVKRRSEEKVRSGEERSNEDTPSFSPSRRLVSLVVDILHSSQLEEEVKALRGEVEKLKGTANKAEEDGVKRGEEHEEEKKSLTEAIRKLTESLKAKDAAVESALKEKAKIQNYTSSVLSKFQDKYLVALTQCKRKLKDEQAKAEALEAKLKQDKALSRREEKLLSSSIYTVGMRILEQQR